MNPADSFIIKRGNRNRSFCGGLQLVCWSCSYFCLTSWILSSWSSSSGGSWACCLASCSMAVCRKRRIWLGFMQTICQCRAAMRQRVDCKMIQRLLYDAVGKRKEYELNGSLRYIKVVFITSEHQIQHRKPQSYPPSRGNKKKKLLGHLPPSGEREEQQQTTTVYQ